MGTNKDILESLWEHKEKIMSSVPPQPQDNTFLDENLNKMLAVEEALTPLPSALKSACPVTIFPDP